MILTVTPNACVDKTYRIAEFRLDRVNRPDLTYTIAGGKGVNVARVYQTLGGEAVATGLLGGINGQIVARALAKEGIADAFVRLPIETRVCIAVIDAKTWTQTEINESGQELTPPQAKKLIRHVERLLNRQQFEVLVLSGSLPPGAPVDLYADLIGSARAAGVKAVVDTSGQPLHAAVGAQPWMIKPNQAELEGLLGRPICGREETLEAARELRAHYRISVVAVTLGASGAVLVTEQGAWAVEPPPIVFVSAVASGDSFLAALLWAWNDADPAAALRLATGAGAANAAIIGAGLCTRDSILSQAEKARIELLRENNSIS